MTVQTTSEEVDSTTENDHATTENDHATCQEMLRSLVNYISDEEISE